MRVRRVFSIILFLCVMCLSACGSSEYQNASTLFSEGKYEEAVTAFRALGDYKDSPHMVDESTYYWAKQLLEEGQWKEAAQAARSIVTDDTDLNKSLDMLFVKCDLEQARQLSESGQYQDALEICQKIIKEQTNSSLVVAADNLRRECLKGLEAGDAAQLLKDAQAEYRKENWRDVISLCEQICEIAPGTEIAANAEELHKKAKKELESELSTLLSDLQKAYDAENWEEVVNLSSIIINSYSEYSDEVRTAEQLSGEAKQKIQAIVAEELGPALEKLNEEYDDVEGITWYMPSSEPRYINDYCVSYLYIGQRENRSPWLRWRTILVDNEWLFFDELIINVDGKVYSVHCSYNDVVRDSNNRNYWEYTDFEPKSADLEIIRAIINSETTIIRFSNDDEDKIYDYTVTQKEKDGFKDVLEAFELMKLQG